jgi:chaperone modulatory protein CbpM
MTSAYAPEQVIESVTTLPAERLSHFERLRIVTPVTTSEGPRYQSLDVRRIALLCELTDDFEVNEDALVIIMSLLDQLHGVHFRLEQVVRAIDAEPSETKLRLSQRLHDNGATG